jgi:hypothetical protein
LAEKDLNRKKISKQQQEIVFAKLNHDAQRRQQLKLLVYEIEKQKKTNLLLSKVKIFLKLKE